MGCTVGNAVGKANQIQVLLAEAIEDAIAKSPPPDGSDVMNFRLLSVELEHGGFTQTTTPA